MKGVSYCPGDSRQCSVASVCRAALTVLIPIATLEKRRQSLCNRGGTAVQRSKTFSSFTEPGGDRART